MTNDPTSGPAPGADVPEPAHDAAMAAETPAAAAGSDDEVEAEVDEIEAAAEAAHAAVADISVESLIADLERVNAERDGYLDALRRTQADFENFRKQAQRRLDEAVQRSLSGFVQRLLPVLDACDAALSHGATEVEPILTALHQALEKEGLSRVAPVGEPFDPEVAEAVVHEPGGGGDHIVTDVLRAGYLWNGRVLRPAMVKVSD
jgi:molecular chaperone GrpE